MGRKGFVERILCVLGEGRRGKAGERRYHEQLLEEGSHVADSLHQSRRSGVRAVKDKEEYAQADAGKSGDKPLQQVRDGREVAQIGCQLIEEPNGQDDGQQDHADEREERCILDGHRDLESSNFLSSRL